MGKLQRCTGTVHTPFLAIAFRTPLFSRVVCVFLSPPLHPSPQRRQDMSDWTLQASVGQECSKVWNRTCNGIGGEFLLVYITHHCRVTSFSLILAGPVAGGGNTRLNSKGPHSTQTIWELLSTMYTIYFVVNHLHNQSYNYYIYLWKYHTMLHFSNIKKGEVLKWTFIQNRHVL